MNPRAVGVGARRGALDLEELGCPKPGCGAAQATAGAGRRRSRRRLRLRGWPEGLRHGASSGGRRVVQAARGPPRALREPQRASPLFFLLSPGPKAELVLRHHVTRSPGAPAPHHQAVAPRRTSTRTESGSPGRGSQAWAALRRLGLGVLGTAGLHDFFSSRGDAEAGIGPAPCGVGGMLRTPCPRFSRGWLGPQGCALPCLHPPNTSQCHGVPTLPARERSWGLPGGAFMYLCPESEPRGGRGVGRGAEALPWGGGVLAAGLSPPWAAFPSASELEAVVPVLGQGPNG